MSWYVGLNNRENRIGEIFWSDDAPTEQTHGDKFKAVIGPFRTKRGAEYMRFYGPLNPHCTTVAEAEKLAKEKDNAR